MKIFVRDMNNLPVFRKLWEVNPNIIFGIDTRFKRYRVGSRQERLECNFFTDKSKEDEFFLYTMQKLFPGSSVCYLATFVVLENGHMRYEVLHSHKEVKREEVVSLMKEYHHEYETPLTKENITPIKKILGALEQEQ